MPFHGISKCLIIHPTIYYSSINEQTESFLVLDSLKIYPGEGKQMNVKQAGN